MKEYEINGKKYILKENYKEAFNVDETKEKITDYFNDFDYIFGDYAYDKLRLKGFYRSDNKKASDVNNIEKLDDYIQNYCAYGAKWFLLEKNSE